MRSFAIKTISIFIFFSIFKYYLFSFFALILGYKRIDACVNFFLGKCRFPNSLLEEAKGK